MFFYGHKVYKVFNIFKDFHLINWDVGGDMDRSKQALK